MYTHTHTHTHTYVWIMYHVTLCNTLSFGISVCMSACRHLVSLNLYTCVCVCVCVCCWGGGALLPKASKD